MEKTERNWEMIWTRIKKYLFNKYALTLLIFLLIMLFAGEQSVGSFIRRGREIKKTEEQRDMYREGTKAAEDGIQMLQYTDSLERYAREQYYMHAPNEDVYVVNE